VREGKIRRSGEMEKQATGEIKGLRYTVLRSSGVYFVSLEGMGMRAVRKVVLVR